jgi:glycosyltransferase involved in cell wall biosynthesis
MPDALFVIIGAWRDDAIRHLQAIAPPNVKFTNWVSELELRDYLSRARVYVQASRHEGFGLAVAEAMASECVPVVTRAGALPEVVGDAGVYIDSSSPEAVAAGVRQALALNDRAGRRVRERIIREFPLIRRQEALYHLLDRITHA